MIQNSIIDKAKSLLSQAAGLVDRGTKVYDASKNRVIIAGLELDGVVTATRSGGAVTHTEAGLHHTYQATYDLETPLRLSVDVLPTAKCNDVLIALHAAQKRMKKWVVIAIYENGNIIDSYRGYLETIPDIGMQKEASDRQYTFSIKSVSHTIQPINQPNITGETPVAIEVPENVYVPE